MFHRKLKARYQILSQTGTIWYSTKCKTASNHMEAPTQLTTFHVRKKTCLVFSIESLWANTWGIFDGSCLLTVVLGQFLEPNFQTNFQPCEKCPKQMCGSHSIPAADQRPRKDHFSATSSLKTWQTIKPQYDYITSMSIYIHLLQNLMQTMKQNSSNAVTVLRLETQIDPTIWIGRQAASRIIAAASDGQSKIQSRFNNSLIWTPIPTSHFCQFSLNFNLALLAVFTISVCNLQSDQPKSSQSVCETPCCPP